MAVAKYKKGKNAKYAESVNDDDERPSQSDSLGAWWSEIDIPIQESVFNIDNRSCSAINPSLFASNFFEAIPEVFDEFGFQVTVDSAAGASATEIETSHDRMRWLALLEFSHDDVSDELKWSHIDVKKIDHEKLMALVYEIGISHSLRPFLWPRFCGATSKKLSSKFTYIEVVEQCKQLNHSISAQIEKDLSRTLTNNVCFWRPESKGIDGLRRILKAVAYIYPDIGYCQGMGVIAACLLLFCPEETSFWMMTSLIEDILPANYYSRSLLGLQADERVARQLVTTHLPDLDKILKNNDVELSLITINWLLTIFSSVLNIRVLLRVWDCLFVMGSATIFRVLVSMLKIGEEDLLQLESIDNISTELFNAISQIPFSITKPEHLMELCNSFEFSITRDKIEVSRRRQQAVLLANQGLIINTKNDANLPKQRIQRRRLTQSKSIVQQIFSSSTEQDSETDPKMKNIRQTELVVDVRDAVQQICRYFIDCDESFEKIVTLQADYSSKGHLQEWNDFLNARRLGYKRARALLDFERQEEDELGFRRNDIITVISEKNEHCWVGEVNGLRGWFPAKFVEMVDDRSGNYTIYGDEAVCPEVTEKIRGILASAIKPILEHGFRKSGVLNFASHPWLFIEEIAQSFVRKKYNVVYSRLTLCSTFSLDQDGKILTPEELLFRAVQLINESHNAACAPMDVKLRSLVALGVSEQCLHLWFDLLCGYPEQDGVRNKYFHSWSFIRSPVWRQIKCELQLLSQFSFNLSVDLEIANMVRKKSCDNGSLLSKKKASSNMRPNNIRSSFDHPFKEGVSDMLMKHHLFSWDL